MHTADERLTTVEARAELAERGAFRGSGARRRHEIDHPVAARIILESWLGERRPDGSAPKAGGGASAAPSALSRPIGPGPLGSDPAGQGPAHASAAEGG